MAVALFLEHGFEATTADQIAAASGISRRTFFRHFPTKEAALFSWFDDIGMDIAAIVEGRPHDESVSASLRAGLQYLVDYAETDRERLKAIKTLTGPNGLFPNLKAAKKTQWLETLTHLLMRRIPGLDETDAALHVTVAFCAFDTATARWTQDTMQSLSALVDEAFRTVAAGFMVSRAP